MEIVCRKCLHYFVTWDKDKPHGCRAMGFKSRQTPSLVVRQTTPGMECQLFEPRPQAKPSGNSK